MTIPDQIENCLHQHGIPFEVVEDTTNKTVATLLILGDEKGKIQFLIPANTLLDLALVCHRLGRNLRALSPEKTQEITASYGTVTIPAIPPLLDLPLAVDKSLLDAKDVCLETGLNGAFLKLNDDAFKTLMKNAEVGEFAIALNQQLENDDIADVHQAIEEFTSLRIRQRLEQTLEMPPLPMVAERIIQLRIDPDASITDLADVVEKDPSLSAQVVSWACSPYYSAPGSITSVHDAVIRVLGFDLVINLALGLSLGNIIKPSGNGALDIDQYWQQSVDCAALMEGLVRAIPPEHRPSMGLAYLSGLLHNYGQLVLAHVFPPHFALTDRHIKANTHIRYSHVERHLLHITRNQMGSALMKCWGMPDEVVAALRWQQQPEYQGEHKIYSQLLYVANQLMVNEDLIPGVKEPISNEFYAALHIKPEKAQAALDRLIEHREDLVAMASALSQ